MRIALTCGGLSPRLRGNLRAVGTLIDSRRSIPASAGEPGSTRREARQAEVYPRVCGGTVKPRVTRPVCKGLSPRLRGNLCSAGWWVVLGRSIPASAGEPCSTMPDSRFLTVYPRVCGGTLRRRKTRSYFSGLSPRLRGNPPSCESCRLENRSIPASAGEPPCRAGHTVEIEVYPRVCGGTVRDEQPLPGPVGLSPRLRGNRLQGRRCAGRWRSIPASAGEPGASWTGTEAGWVYPRVCGGTLAGLAIAGIKTGLSPRLRGNLVFRGAKTKVSRSIPASAGEPPLISI